MAQIQGAPPDRRHFIRMGCGAGAAVLGSSSAASAQSYVARVRPDVLSWLESVRYPDEGWGRWKYKRHMTRPYGLQACGMAIGILDILGELPRIPHEKKLEAIRFYQSCQDPKDGYFKDPLVRESDRFRDLHSWEHIWSQMSSIASALTKLGGQPLHPRPTKRFINTQTLPPDQWHMQFAWKNPWLVGEQWSNAIKGYWQSLPADKRSPDHAVIETAFRAMERAVLDPATGYPLGGGCTDRAVAMAGLFKLASAYLEVGRPVPHAAEAINSTLALQQPDGEFADRSDMCFNWDALWVLRLLDAQLNGMHRHTDIVTSGERCAEMLLVKYRKPDGGFARHGKLCMTEHNSIRLGPSLPEGDMLGTKFSLECFSYVDAWRRGGAS